MLITVCFCRIWRSSYPVSTLRAVIDDVNQIQLLILSFARLLREVDAWGAAFKTALTAADPKFEGEILGSYRRGDPWSSDVDFVVRHKDYNVVRCWNPMQDCIPGSADPPLRRRIWTPVVLC